MANGSVLKVRLEEYLNQLKKLKEDINLYENEQSILSSFQKLCLSESKPAVDLTLWEQKVFTNKIRFNKNNKLSTGRRRIKLYNVKI